MRRLIVGLVGGVFVFVAGHVQADSVAPGFSVEVYATVSGPQALSFDPAGNLYAGRDDSGASWTPHRIHRISPGGFSVTEYGNTTITDPDIVLFDGAGTISGTPGSVLVSGGNEIMAIRPNESIIQVPDLPGLNNLNGMAFDSTGRLLFTDMHNLFATSGGAPTTLVSFGALRVDTIAVAGDDRIYVSVEGGIIQVYNPDGTLADGSFAANGVGLISLAFASGGAFGEDLYGVEKDHGNGNLFRFTGHGESTLFGTGFSSIAYLTFGPDQALYVSERARDRVLRISSRIPGDTNGDGMVNDLDAATLATYWQYGGTIEIGWEHGDFNGDGKVTDADAAILATHWQEGVEGTAPVPEPSAILLLAGGLLLLLPWRRKRATVDLACGM